MLQVPICDICEVSTKVYWDVSIQLMGFISELTPNWNRSNFRVAGLMTAANFSIIAKIT